MKKTMFILLRSLMCMGEHGAYDMGLGVDTTYNTPVVGHDGSMFGFKANMFWLPEHTAWVRSALVQQVLDERSSSAKQAAPSPDAFGYELTIESASERCVISFDYAHASDAMKHLLQTLRPKSEPAR